MLEVVLVVAAAGRREQKHGKKNRHKMCYRYLLAPIDRTCSSEQRIYVVSRGKHGIHGCRSPISRVEVRRLQ